MDSTESPKSLYALSLRQVVHRLNRLCNYVKVGRHLDDQLLFLSEKGDKTGLFFSPPPADILVCFEHHHPSSSRQVQRLSFNHHNEAGNEGDRNLEDEEGEEDIVKRNSPFCDEFPTSSRSFLHGGRNSSSSSNGIGNLDANSIDNNAKLLKNRMKKSYHSLLNTFIFGGGSSSSSGNSSKKPPMSPNGSSLASSSFSSSSSSSFSNSSSETPPSEQDRLRASYRVAADLVEDIFNEYQRRYPLTDRSLKLAIFGGSVNHFRRVEIKEAGQLTTAGLSMLAGHHQLTSLSVAHLNSAAVSINELISCLAPVTAAQHLTSLSVRHCNFSGSRPYNSGCSSKAACLVLSIGQLPRLTNLDVSFTDFNNHALEVVAEDLPHLVSLNISSTKVTLLGPIASNRGLVSRLKVLLAHNTAGSCRDEHLLEGLTSLERLDISDSRSYLDTSQNSLNKLLTAFATFPKLVELDLSGRNGVDYHEVEQLVVARQSSSSSNPNQAEVTPLRFLGLLETNLNYDDLLDLMKASAEPITLTGNGNIHHILESLRRYKDCSVFVQKSLLHLYQTRFNLDSEEMLAQRPAIIRLILDLLTTNLSSVNIVLVSTACLYIFTQMNVFAGGGVNGSNHPPLHPHLLTKVVKVNMATMTKYATNQPVMKNILLTLCSDRILQEIPFDRMHCMQLVMDSLITFSEPTLNRLALAVCSILAAKIPTEQTTSIGQQVKYMGRLLEFVQRSNAAIDTDNRDVLFKLALSALWNFTDESPKTCQTFIENRGLQLYIEALVLYHGQNSVETKILGLINNIAEVPYLRKDLIDGNLLANLKNLIQSEHIDISYFSAGILSQLASDRSLDWSQLKDFSLPEVLDEMKQVILSWQTPNFEMVAYRSFVPFIALLTCRPHPAVQLWALWAIHHVCTKSGSQKYCQMLYDERCLSLIADILDDRIRAIGRQSAGGGGDCFSSLAQVAFMRGRLVRNATPDCYPSGGDLPFETGSGSGGSGSRQGSPSRANKDFPQCSFLFSPCVTVPQEKEVLKIVEEKEEVLQLMLHRSNTNQLSLFTCDCKLAHYLRRDPFLALPALILHTFAQECPRLVAKDFQF